MAYVVVSPDGEQLIKPTLKQARKSARNIAGWLGTKSHKYCGTHVAVYGPKGELKVWETIYCKRGKH